MQQNCRSKKIRKGDHVFAITGNDKGRYGSVLSCKGDKVIVQGLNLRKKHVKPGAAAGRIGLIEIEAPIHISNVRLCTPAGEPIKVKVRLNSEGQRELYYLHDGHAVTYRTIKKNLRG